MSIQVQHRRDVNTVIDTVTPAQGEIGFDTTKKELFIGDGTTLAGMRQQKKNTREGLAPAQITANTNDYNPTGLKHAAVLELTTDVSRNLTGLVPTTVVDTTDGRAIVLYNNGSANLVVQDQNASSAAANRFDLGGADITLSPKQSIALRYNLTSTRWQIVGGNFGQAISDGSVSARKLATSALGANSGMINGTIVESHAGNAVTFAIKTLAGNDPSATDPVYFVFRDATAATGDFIVRTVTAALSFTISSGSSMGFSNGVPGRLWLTAIDNAGTVLLGAINCTSSSGIFPLGGFDIISTTAEGGAGAADSAQVMYAASAVASKAFLILGYASYETGVATAGSWAASPSRLQLYGPGVKLPGDLIQSQISIVSSVATGSTIIPLDDTIPQNTEGDQYLSQAVTPSSAANRLRQTAKANLSQSVATGSISMALFQDATANALAATAKFGESASGGFVEMSLRNESLAGVNVSTTFKVRIGPSAAATVTLNGATGARFFGGVSNSYLLVEELMG